MTPLLRRLVAAVILTIALGASAAGATERPDPDLAYPDDPQLQEAYARGFDDGYSDGDGDGYRRGLDDGESANVDRSDLRDDVDALEGGEDLGDEITPSTPTPTPTSSPSSSLGATTMPEPQDQGSGIPWWPLSFATVATVWFVLRRRREPQLEHEQD